MTRVASVTCDACEHDLTYTGNCEGYRLHLHVENIPNPPGTTAVTLLAIYPPLDGEKHFCGRRCLAEWVKMNA